MNLKTVLGCKGFSKSKKSGGKIVSRHTGRSSFWYQLEKTQARNNIICLKNPNKTFLEFCGIHDIISCLFAQPARCLFCSLKA